MKKAGKKIISFALALFMLLIMTHIETMPVSASDTPISIDKAEGASYSLFNSGSTGAGISYNGENIDETSHENGGYDLYMRMPAHGYASMRLGLSFTVNADIKEKARLFVLAYDIDESEGETNTVYLVNETNGTRVTLGTLSGMDDTWNNTSFDIQADYLIKGNSYHIEQKITDSQNRGYTWWVYVRTVDLIVDGTVENSRSEISSADLSASISSNGLVSVRLYAAAYEQDSYKIEYKAVCLSDSAQYGGKETNVTIPVSGNTFTDSFRLESSSPHGSFRITAFIKNVAGSVIASRELTVEYDCFAVSYNANGGLQNLPGDPTSYKSGDTVTVKFDYIPSRAGYVFEGWSEDQSAIEAVYTEAGNTTFTIGSDNVILYAVWRKVTCTHNWQETSRTEATCTEVGIKHYACIHCYETKDEEIPASGHNLEYCAEVPLEYRVDKNQEGYKCAKCGAYVLILPSVAEPKGAYISVGTVNAKPGKTVTVPIELKNAPDIKSMSISNIVYDTDKITLTKVEWICNAEIKNWDAAQGKGVLSFTENTDANGVILNLVFTVNSPVEDSVVSVGCDFNVFQMDEQGEETPVDVTITEGEVNIRNPVRGDMDENGRLNSDDAVYLLYSIMFGDDEYPVNQNADVNGDGKTNSDDAVYLLYYVMFGEDDYPLH